ncbi:hypothetical protein BG011_009878 [Mortierella polycephala]|uniref:Uncharacterized protein n=1 Tax=Mortierella polycephala TaxID=41804 RepID=A0A9P6PNG3_9FUNG|nr:hypothetical protein BG011_009878 [Mortierella polycephala]
MATLHYGFFCAPERPFFLSFSFLMGVIGCVLPTVCKDFDLPSFRYFRMSIFLGMVLSGSLPWAYSVYLKGMTNTLSFIAPISKSGLAYFLGVVVYGHRFPERQFPGLFDTWGHSHQVWHVAVVAGIYYHYQAMVHFFEARYTFGCLSEYGAFERYVQDQGQGRNFSL